MVVNVSNIFQKMKNKSLFSIEKNIKEWEIRLYYSYKTVFQFRKFGLSIKESIWNLFLLRLYFKSSLSTNEKYEIFDFYALQVTSWNISSFLTPRNFSRRVFFIFKLFFKISLIFLLPQISLLQMLQFILINWTSY